MKEQIREIIRKATTDVSSSPTNTYNCILSSNYDRLVDDLDDLLSSKHQTKDLLIAMLESQLKVEEIKYQNSKFDVYSGECFSKIKLELERQLKELKG